MEFFDVIKKRHCCRNYDPKKQVSEEYLDKIVEAGKMAPSARGLHPVRFSIITNPEEKTLLAKQDFVADAPAVLIIWVDLKIMEEKFGEDGRNFLCYEDASAAAENCFLAAVALGLSSCWVCSFIEENVIRILGIGQDERVVVVMPIGYSKEAS